MTEGPEQWQLVRGAPELYERHLVPAVTLPWAVDLVDRVGVGPGDRVLDLACGTGVVARTAAPRVQSAGRVVALDVNAGMLEVARSLAPASGRSIEWREGSALALPFDDGEFQVVLCQLGLQFFPDRPRAVREIRRVLGPRGRVGASVYSAIERNPASHALAGALDRRFGPGASRAKRAEHSLAGVRVLRALFADAGFAEVRVETVICNVHFASVGEYVRVQLTATPLAALLAEQELAISERLIALVIADVSDRLARYAHENGVDFPQEVHVALAAS
jgi:ubiquinone/menaquinone biosynthesis C-methylase UbiE